MILLVNDFKINRYRLQFSVLNSLRSSLFHGSPLSKVSVSLWIVCKDFLDLTLDFWAPFSVEIKGLKVLLNLSNLRESKNTS